MGIFQPAMLVYWRVGGANGRESFGAGDCIDRSLTWGANLGNGHPEMVVNSKGI